MIKIRKDALGRPVEKIFKGFNILYSWDPIVQDLLESRDFNSSVCHIHEEYDFRGRVTKFKKIDKGNTLVDISIEYHLFKSKWFYRITGQMNGRYITYNGSMRYADQNVIPNKWYTFNIGKEVIA